VTPLLDVRALGVSFVREGRIGRVVDDVSYKLSAGDTLGIVGESGSGKSVHVLAMLGLLPKTAASSVRGSVFFEGRDLLSLDEPELREIRGRKIGFVFQDPMTSLNPVLTVGRQIAEPLRRHRGLSQAKALARAAELLELVGIRDASRRLLQYPHEFSGGMRQRVMIAIAISCEPRLLIADEPTTALDVTVQGQIIELVGDLRRRLGMAMIWITHDMGVVAGLADTVQVMYGGRVMERGPVRSIFRDPRSAYTWSLLRSLPQGAREAGRRLQQIPGQPPSLFDMPPGDPFAPRNPFATERCHREAPPLRPAENSAPDHVVAAWYDLREWIGRSDGGGSR
jgi:peptide/nickel transport system ATP-binding protein/oligopeptide transport system ATP-binding protein